MDAGVFAKEAPRRAFGSESAAMAFRDAVQRQVELAQAQTCNSA